MNAKRLTAKVIALLALVVTFVAPILFAFKMLSDAPMKAALLAATVGWFIGAPLWLKGGQR